MANFLEAIGRTNALTQGVQAITNTALAMKQMGMQEAEVSRRTALDERQMKLLEAAGTREQELFDQQQTDLNRITPWDRVVSTIMPTAGPEVQKKLNDFFESQGLLTEVSGQKVISKRNLMQGIELFKGNIALTRSVDEMHLQEIGDQIKSLTSQLTNTEKPPSEKEAGNLMMKIKTLQLERTQVLDTLNSLDQETRKAMVTASKSDVKAPNIEIKPISKTMQQKFQFNPQTGQYDIPFGTPYPISSEGAGTEQTRINQVRDDARSVLKGIYGQQTMYGIVIDPARMKDFQEAEKLVPFYADKFGGDLGGVLAAQRIESGKNYKILQAKIKEFQKKKISNEKIITDLEEKGVDSRMFKELW